VKPKRKAALTLPPDNVGAGVLQGGIVPVLPPTTPAHPPHWTRGQLLDLKRFTDGSYRATLLGEAYDPEKGNGLDFDSSVTAQNFISWWYQPAAGRWG
jgi:hypothetical protein